MKEYPEILSYLKAPKVSCIAFEKYDGSNLRFAFNRKKGWGATGTRHRLFDKTDPMFGCSIELFQDTLADPLAKILLKDKSFRSMQDAVVFCEFYGKSSFAGYHVDDEPKTLTIIDVAIHKKGFVLPREFTKIFAELPIAKVVYEGNLNQPFIEDIKNNKYNLNEGVVCKGSLPNKSAQHTLWMCKIKTLSWLSKLKAKAKNDSSFDRELLDNLNEQLCQLES